MVYVLPYHCGLDLIVCNLFLNEAARDKTLVFTVAHNVYKIELGGMTKNLYHGIFLNYTGFTVYYGIYFFHA